MANADEKWLPIQGYPNYFVSNLGRVKHHFRILKPYLAGRSSCQYLIVRLYNKDQNRQRPVHQLVLEAFVGPRPVECEEANHEDGDRMNNTPENLKWCTVSYNAQHAIKKLEVYFKSGELWLIRRLLRARIKQTTIAKMFKVVPSTISKINTGDRYGGISNEC